MQIQSIPWAQVHLLFNDKSQSDSPQSRIIEAKESIWTASINEITEKKLEKKHYEVGHYVSSS
jgi:hypothetical protein